MRILIISNPIVGIRKEKKAVIDTITADIKKRGGTVDITYILKPGMGSKHASRASLEGYDAVYAAGGDGTINEVASGLVGKELPLGIIPLGTGNGLARGLGIPVDRVKMTDVLSKQNIRTIDCGVIGSRYFFATAGIGYDANIAHDFNINRGLKTSMYQYITLAVKNYFLLNPETLALTIDGMKMSEKLFALTICNTSQYGGGATIAPQADPESGSLVAVLIPKINMFKAVFSVPRLFNGSVATVKDIRHITFNQMTIRREKPGIFQVDGETHEGGKTLEVTVKPRSLKVYVP